MKPTDYEPNSNTPSGEAAQTPASTGSNEDNFRDLQDNMKCPNIRIIGVPEEDKKKDNQKILEGIIVENFPKMGKEIITQV